MPVHDFRSQRLFLDTPLARGLMIELDASAVNYVVNVLRMKAGARLLVFNGRDGEWEAELVNAARRQAEISIGEQTRAQTGGPALTYAFAPLKRARLDYMVQKATELGVQNLTPVLTDRTVTDRIKLDRMRANVIEAAEQCGILRVPEISEPVRLSHWLAARTSSERPPRLIVCDESAPIADPVAALSEVTPGPTAVLIGPEGGFSDAERSAFRAVPDVVVLSLGPRIMRADTAAVAALTLVNAVIGDWRE